VGSGACLARPDHLQCLSYPSLPGLLPLGLRDPAGVLLAVGESHPFERGSRLRVSGQGRRQRLGHLDLARCLVKLDRHLDLVAGLDARTVTYLAVQADQELPPIRATLVRQV
jgi:hypothetical protein